VRLLREAGDSGRSYQAYQRLLWMIDAENSGVRRQGFLEPMAA